ncbi:TetR/AcrR family transcriptional regulator [Schaalia sp. 19OD2882]|uniref:TetR/AcrR family transcriptional regulator n=1 Tax=Schaalia sp. 19OD2882 TaxID=2794089 RepID=UPI0020A7EF09|nr:TetR/AcrR family transcriptional regulator [Schaalia sp. 19OD2882]
MASDKRVRGAYSAGLATRDAILVAAMRLIAQSGFRGFSLRDLGRAVGVSHPAVIYHFPSKEALLTAVVKRYEDMVGIFAVDIDERTGRLVEKGLRVKSVLEWAIQVMRMSNHPEAMLLRDLGIVITVEAAWPEHPAHEHANYRFHETRVFIEREIRSLQERGVISFPINPVTIADAALREWNGIAVQARYPKGTAETNSVADYLAVMAHTMGLPPEYILDLGAMVPSDVAEVFAQALRRYKDMRP